MICHLEYFDAFCWFEQIGKFFWLTPEIRPVVGLPVWHGYGHVFFVCSYINLHCMVIPCYTIVIVVMFDLEARTSTIYSSLTL